MVILPTTYWGTEGWWGASSQRRDASLFPSQDRDLTLKIEVMESFPKQTFRNRCIILDPTEKPIVLTVPVKRVDSKQFTRDVEISYQTKWQHQHWNAIMSAYKKTPYFDYYQDYIRPLYERETKWLTDLNDETYCIVKALLSNEMPKARISEKTEIDILHTDDWAGLDLESIWGNETCILDKLFKYGPKTQI